MFGDEGFSRTTDPVHKTVSSEQSTLPNWKFARRVREANDVSNIVFAVEMGTFEFNVWLFSP